MDHDKMFDYWVSISCPTHNHCMYVMLMFNMILQVLLN